MTINIQDVHAKFAGQGERYPKILYRIVKREGIPTFIITNNGKVYDDKYNQIKIINDKITGSSYFKFGEVKLFLSNETVAAFKLVPEVVSEGHTELPMSDYEFNHAHILSHIVVKDYSHRQFKNNPELIKDAVNMFLYTKYTNTTIALALGMNNSPVGQLKNGNIYAKYTGFTQDTFISERNIQCFRDALQEVTEDLTLDAEDLLELGKLSRIKNIIYPDRTSSKEVEEKKVKTPPKKSKEVLMVDGIIETKKKEIPLKEEVTVDSIISFFNKDPNEMREYLECMDLAKELLDRGFKLP